MSRKPRPSQVGAIQSGISFVKSFSDSESASSKVFLLKCITGGGKGYMSVSMVNSPELNHYLAIFIVPAKGGIEKQTADNLREESNGVGRVIELSSENQSDYRPRIADKIVTSIEKCVGKTADGKSLKSLNRQDRTGNIFDIVAQARAEGIEVVIIRDEAHLQGDGWKDFISDLTAAYAKGLPIIEMTATPDRPLHAYDAYHEIPVMDSVEDGLVRSDVIFNPITEHDLLGNESRREISARNAYAKLLELRDIFREHLLAGTCTGNGAGCFAKALPKGICQISSIKELRDTLALLKKVSGGVLSEESGTVLVVTSDYKSKDKDGNVIDPSSIMDPDSPVLFVIHHRALNEGYDASCLQVFLSWYDSKSVDFAVQSFGRCVRTHGGTRHTDAALEVAYVFTDAGQLGAEQFRLKVREVYLSEKKCNFDARLHLALAAQKIVVSRAYREKRSHFLIRKVTGEPVSNAVATREFARLSEKEITSVRFSIDDDGGRMPTLQTDMESISAGSALSVDYIEITRLDEKEVEGRVETWVSNNILPGTGFSAENRIFKLLILPALRSRAKSFLKYAEVQEDIDSRPETRDMDDSEKVIRLVWSNLDDWKGTIQRWLSGYAPDPDREGRDVTAGVFSADSYAESFSVIHGHSDDELDIPKLPWAMTVDGTPYRARSRDEGKFKTERKAEEFFLSFAPLKSIHRNVQVSAEVSLSLGYLSPDGKTAHTSYPDYVISYENRGREIISIIEVKEYPTPGSQYAEKTETMARVYDAYSRTYGIPACIAVEHKGEQYAYFGDGKMERLTSFLGREWNRSSATPADYKSEVEGAGVVVL